MFESDSDECGYEAVAGNDEVVGPEMPESPCASSVADKLSRLESSNLQLSAQLSRFEQSTREIFGNAVDSRERYHSAAMLRFDDAATERKQMNDNLIKSAQLGNAILGGMVEIGSSCERVEGKAAAAAGASYDAAVASRDAARDSAAARVKAEEAADQARLGGSLASAAAQSATHAFDVSTRNLKQGVQLFEQGKQTQSIVVQSAEAIVLPERPQTADSQAYLINEVMPKLVAAEKMLQNLARTAAPTHPSRSTATGKAAPAPAPANPAPARARMNKTSNRTVCRPCEVGGCYCTNCLLSHLSLGRI
jgi:hypothetical protein